MTNPGGEKLPPTFAELGVRPEIVSALAENDIVRTFAIQELTLPLALAGEDVIGQARTGTGKTLGFGVPLLQRITPPGERAAATAEGEAADRTKDVPQALVVVPTRELCVQVARDIAAAGKNLGVRVVAIYGGRAYEPQLEALRKGVDVIVGTPGRLLDLMNQKHLRLDAVEHFVLDEADRMLDMGFIRDVRKVVAALPKKRQTLFFSATMPADVAGLAGDILCNPVEVAVTPAATPVERIDQRVYFVEAGDKRTLLTQLVRDAEIKRAIVFTRTKHRANRVADNLRRAGIEADAIHGNKSQGARQKALKGFSSGRIQVLVATDIAARGIDIDDVTHVINFELPNVPDDYVHRIGRTARAGASGIAISLCDPSEQAYLRDIEKLTGRPLSIAGGEPAAHEPPPAGRKSRGGGSGQRSQRRTGNKRRRPGHQRRNRAA